MAVGDVVNDIQTIAATANLDFQPAAGVEIMITEVGSSAFAGTTPDQTPDIVVRLWDGTLASAVRTSGEGRRWHPMKLFINNTRRLRLTNQNAASQNLSYTGIQTK